MNNTTRKIKVAIEEYCGSIVESIEVYSDATSYAIRTKIEGDYCEWLLTNFNPRQSTEDIMNNLEEVTYTQWPPVTK